jgi:glycosidase
MNPQHDSPTFEFHVSRAARERYGLDQSWFSITGDLVLADMAMTRRLAYRMNQARDVVHAPERAVHAGQLHAMGLIDEILHYVAALYRRRVRAEAFAQALAAVEQRLGRTRADVLLLAFTREFPPLAVYRGDLGPEDWLAGETAGVSHRRMALEELLLLWLANVNPAFGPFRELFHDQTLAGPEYAAAIGEVAAAFAAMPPFGPDDQPLVDMLRSPAIASPHSLWGQLDYIRTRWRDLLGEFLDRLLVTLDVLREEERAFLLRFATWSEGHSPPPPDFRWLDAEDERFSVDQDWMPRVVLIAKSSHVWLNQLARQYGREITRLDHIPDEELDRLAGWGVTGLWLIGLWERSAASQRIKQLCGNPDALASAYSLADYRIAADLGGDDAYRELEERARRRGLKLASDMVPNHMGIDSRWVIEHPHWFLALEHSPYPAYGFHGPDLSPDPRVSLRIEDHYYDRTDAAVVFQRVDNATGETRYIYHGNDGTFMPWNDTAQLDFLKPEVREGVIQTILHVARQFPIIRFDAAMTLAKRHYQRLWFPEPGSGGAIPSRAEHGLTRAAFDARMPVEFWREVVDRVAAEAPDTLLLAEAFWLMEGYFVRTLGMHRVYNSAFMNMLRDEDNAGYRSVIKNTLEFDPEILKRYVNFMNNPDERTAVDQFGKGDKYFGVCTLMATLPGLPMLGHGQVEGFAERYGMEFRRAAWEETPDFGLIERHEREIFPLLRRRRLFADAGDFLLFDFFTADGKVNEDVFAYSNRHGNEAALVIYHNRFADTAGWIRESAAFARGRGGEERVLVRRTLAEGLGLTAAPGRWCRFRDQRSGLEYLRSSQEIHERGLYSELNAYGCHVFVDIHEVASDAEHPWDALASELAGRGVPRLDDALREIALRPLTRPLRALLAADLLWALAVPEPRPASTAARPASALDAHRAEVERRLRAAIAAVRERAGEGADAEVAIAGTLTRLGAVLALPGPIPGPAPEARNGAPGAPGAERPAAAPDGPPAAAEPGASAPRARETLVAWALVAGIARAWGERNAAASLARWWSEWSWDRVVAESLEGTGLEAGEAWRAAERILLLATHVGGFRAAAAAGDSRAAAALDAWLGDERARRLLGVNLHQGTWWIGKEALESWVGWLSAAATVEREAGGLSRAERDREARGAAALAARVLEAAAAAGYRVEALAERVRG